MSVQWVRSLSGAAIAVALLFQTVCAQAQISLMDDAGQTLILATPAKRIVSLAPHITELLYFVGAESSIVGVSEFSDFPEAAKKLPVVGRHDNVDFERLVRLKPDVVIVWGRGSANAKVDQMKSLGLRVVYSDPQTLSNIADNMLWMSQLAGTEAFAQPHIESWRNRLNALSAMNAEPKAELSVFYQVWDRPLMTINRQQLISQGIQLCGGRNIFADLPLLTPTVSTEAVVRANPDLIVFSKNTAGKANWAQPWLQWKKIKAVAHQQIIELPPDLLVRSGPRMLDGLERLCAAMDKVRGTP